jgi:hypothetical protein
MFSPFANLIDGPAVGAVGLPVGVASGRIGID